jgi:hypothetical protein
MRMKTNLELDHDGEIVGHALAELSVVRFVLSHAFDRSCHVADG